MGRGCRVRDVDYFLPLQAPPPWGTMGRGCEVRDVDYFLPLQAPRNETSSFQFLRCRKHVVCFAFALRQILLHVISMLIALQSYKFSARYTNLSPHISSRTKHFAVLRSPYVPKVRTSWHLPEVRTSPCFFSHSPCPHVRADLKSARREYRDLQSRNSYRSTLLHNGFNTTDC